MTETRAARRPAVPAERRRMILERLREDGSISVSSVGQEFGVSPMTARRDLAVLADSGRARRTHGGAVLPELAGHEDSFQSRLERNVGVKTRLAAAVLDTVGPHETMFIDSSSTAYYIVRGLIDTGIPATLLTNSLPVMSLVGSADVSQIKLIGLGGSFRTLTRSYVGAETVAMVRRFFVDRVIFSVKGIERDTSLTDPDPLEAEVKRAMVSQARAVQLVAEAHKFDEHGLNVVVDAEAVHTAYLAGASLADERLFRQAGTDVRVV